MTRSGPRWQRARILPDQDGAFHPAFAPGTLVWVRCGPPVPGLVVSRDGTKSFGPLLHLSRRIPETGLLAAFFPSDLELLPEFSDAADPDAEVRQ